MCRFKTCHSSRSSSTKPYHLSQRRSGRSMFPCNPIMLILHFTHLLALHVTHRITGTDSGQSPHPPLFESKIIPYPVNYLLLTGGYPGYEPQLTILSVTFVVCMYLHSLMKIRHATERKTKSANQASSWRLTNTIIMTTTRAKTEPQTRSPERKQRKKGENFQLAG